MNDTGNDLAAAAEMVDKIRAGLRARQEALLFLEVEIGRVQRGEQSPDVLPDQAEDIRRAVRRQRRDQVAPVLQTIRGADQELSDAHERGSVRDVDARTASHAANAVHGTLRRLQMDLDDVSRALTPLAHSMPTDPWLTSVAETGVEDAVKAVDRAQNSAWRVKKDLPIVDRGVSKSNSSEQAPHLLDVAPVPASAALRPDDRSPVSTSVSRSVPR